MTGEAARKLVTRFDETLATIADMLNTLLDINQIDTGAVGVEITDFPIDDLLVRLRNEFAFHAQARELALRVVPCSLSIHSDPHLLEQMIRNLLSNALKYTRHGKVLVGCRRHGHRLSIEVWDTGVGIPEGELQAIFKEYYQLDNTARERSRGLGLGLSIVQRLGKLLDHRVSVRSRPGRGSVFAIEVMLPPNAVRPQRDRQRRGLDHGIVEDARRTAAILVVEDDPEVRELLELVLKDEGHRTAAAADGKAALELVEHGTIRPDLIVADFNLPNEMNGLQVAAKLRKNLRREIPVVVLTGDISTGALRSMALRNAEQLTKPVKVNELLQAIQRLLRISQATAPASTPDTAKAAGGAASPTIFVVDDDTAVRTVIREVLEDVGRKVEDYSSCEAFLEAFHPGTEACLLIDAYLPGMSGLALLQRLNDAGHRLPAIMVTGHSDVSMAVQAMKAGASDFIEKPVGRSELLASVDRALEQSRDTNTLIACREAAAHHMESLTPRQRQIMERVLSGEPSKNIAADLGISQRTVENHRASIMKKTGATSLPALARLALAAASHEADEPLVV